MQRLLLLSPTLPISYVWIHWELMLWLTRNCLKQPRTRSLRNINAVSSLIVCQFCWWCLQLLKHTLSTQTTGTGSNKQPSWLPYSGVRNQMVLLYKCRNSWRGLQHDHHYTFVINQGRCVLILHKSAGTMSFGISVKFSSYTLIQLS